MGCQDDIVETEQRVLWQWRLGIEHVEPRSPDLTGLQCRNQIGLDDHAAPRGVDQSRPAFHLRKERGVAHAARFAVQRAVQTHEVGSAQKFVLVDQFDPVLLHELGVWILLVSDHLHAQRDPSDRRAATDSPEPDQSQCLAPNRFRQRC